MKKAAKAIAKALFVEEEEEQSVADIVDTMIADENIEGLQTITPSAGQGVDEGAIEYLTAVQSALTTHPDLSYDFRKKVYDDSSIMLPTILPRKAKRRIK